MVLIGSILGWFAKTGISAIGDQLNRAYEMKLKATNDHEKLEAEQRISELNAQMQVLIAEQGSWRTSWIRPMLALPVVVYLNKIFIYDKVLALGSTDALSSQLWGIVMAVVSCYLLTRPFENWSKK